MTDGCNGSLYDSTVNVKNIHRLENLIAGKNAFEGLRSPTWPQEISLKSKPRVAAGRTLYICAANCHPLVAELRASRDVQSESDWTFASEGVAGYDSLMQTGSN